MTARHLLGAICALTVIGIGACEQRSEITEPTSPADATPMFEEVLPLDLDANPTAPDVPAVTVAIEEYATTASLLNSVPVGTISPAELALVMQAGECRDEEFPPEWS